MRVRNANGTTTDEIVRFRGAAFETVWSTLESGWSIFGYDAKTAPSILSIMGGMVGNRRIVRVEDGRQLLVKDPCQAVGSDRNILVMLCTTTTLVGNRFLQYIAAYRWPNESIGRNGREPSEHPAL